jgi:glycine/D-amino acid oxidase-like deaminating enzyme
MDFSFNPPASGGDAERFGRVSARVGGGQKVIEIWRGLRPCAPDGLPIISRVKKLENVIVAAGHAMLACRWGRSPANWFHSWRGERHHNWI